MRLALWSSTDTIQVITSLWMLMTPQALLHDDVHLHVKHILDHFGSNWDSHAHVNFPQCMLNMVSKLAVSVKPVRRSLKHAVL